MKITALLLLLPLLQASAMGYGQEKFSLSLDQVEATTVFARIQKASAYRFFYLQEDIKKLGKINIHVTEATVPEIMQKVLGDALAYKIVSDYLVVISPSQLNLQQQLELRGTVTDENGSPLEGASVKVKGQNIGVTTEANGSFTIAVDPKAVLEISMVGYQTVEIPVNGRSRINDIVLKMANSGLEEVVVVGYGTQKKVNLTGAVATVSKEIFENRTLSTPLAAMQGAVPGVGISRTSGKPGSENYQIQIRGFSSVNNVNVLVIIDGVRGAFSELNPNDIESVSVLKDAAAAAIYGSNAAGGVVLITTKKGKNEKVEVNYSGNYGFTHASRMPTRMNSWDEAEYFDQAVVNGTGTLYWGPTKQAWMQGKDLDVIDTYGTRSGVRPSDFPGEQYVIDPTRPNVWLSYGNFDQIAIALRKTNPIQSHNVSLRGGNDKTLYYFSAGYYDREGILRYADDSEERYNLRLNLQNRFAKKVFLNTTLSYTNNNVYAPITSAEGLITNAYKRWGWIDPYLPTGEYHVGNGIWASPIQQQKEEGENNSKNYMFEGSANLAITDVLGGLDLNVVGSKRIGVGKGLAFRRTLKNIGAAGIPINFNPTNSMSKSSTFYNFNSFQAFATYNYQLSRFHKFKLLGGYSFEDYRNEIQGSGINRLVTNDFFSLNWGDAQSASVSDAISTYATMGFFGRLNYNFKEKYLFEANLRYDGSSKLAPENRWRSFPSLSAGWIVSNEDFFPSNDVVNSLKFRASWGQLGNSDALGYYDYIGMLNAASDMPFNNVRNTRIYQSQLASPLKSWEIIETSNIGIDVLLIKNHLSITGDYYVKTNKNMLANFEVPSIIGVGLSTYNIGELKTKGWEVNVEWREMSNKFRYWISANLSDNTNKLVKYSGRNVVIPGMVSLIEGMPLRTIWGYETDGFFQTNEEYDNYGVFISAKTGEGDMKYLDLDKDKKINGGNGTLENHGDLVLLGNETPRYLFGLNLGFEWKGINLNAFFQGVGKRLFFMENSNFQPLLYDWKMPFAEQGDYWTPDNRNAFWPRPYSNGDQSYWASDYWVQNAAYIRLKNIELGYTLPQSFTKRFSINRVKFFVSGQDVFESTKTFSFVDPEYPNNAAIIYPFFRTYLFGLNVTF